MPYNLACFRTMYKNFGVLFHVIKWDKRKLTPFTVGEEMGMRFYNRSDFTVPRMKQLVEQLQPSLIYIVGRMDSGYLQVARYARKKGFVTVSGWDTQWQGTMRQRIACLLSRSLYKRYFDYIIVPGIRQYDYVSRLGYPRNRIALDALSCDVDRFTVAYERRKEMGFPDDKKILYIGRFSEIKGLGMLAGVFQDIRKEGYDEWKLILVGNGPLEGELKNKEGIEVIPFSDQTTLSALLTNISFFCLPSHMEPWGVVIHEMAVAGIPLVLSDACGAAPVFLKEGFNGFHFKNGSAADLKQALIRMIHIESGKRIQMCHRSHELGNHIHPLMWCYSFLRMAKPLS